MTSTFQQAIEAHTAHKWDDAEALYRSVLVDDPARVDVHYNLGLMFGQRGLFSESLHELSLAVQGKPDLGQAWFLLCECADQLDQHDLSLQAGKRAVELMPQFAHAWLRYGLVLNRCESHEKAAMAHQRATEIDPSLVAAWANLCFSLKNMGRLDEARKVIRQAIEVSGQTLSTDEVAEAEYSFLHWHLALLELALDRYTEGFSYFRARFKGGTSWRRWETDKPLWRGQSLQGKTIFVTTEQGHGDMLMMARYVPLLKAQGARLVFQTHPALVPLFKSWDVIDQIVPYGEPLKQPFDFHVPMFDLPYCFGTTIPSIPSQVPYLPVLPVDESQRLEASPQRKIGIIWAGQPDNPRDKSRSIPLSVFADLLNKKENRFYNLTRDLKPGDEAVMEAASVINLAPRINDFAEAAQFISQLDLVITCDTAAAHLAGGMGKPVWVLLPFMPDWRWGVVRETSPWYPTMRLFRQAKPGDWQQVITRVAAALI